MIKMFTPVCIILLCCTIAFAQSTDSTFNNLQHTAGYKTSVYGAIPRYIKAGKGERTLVLIPGLGFDAGIFKDFINANRNNYTLYAITVPGYGKTQAPPMPAAGTSYGEQSWNKGVMKGIMKLVEKENLQKPVLVGHFVQGAQLALRMAIDYPDKIGAVIILGAPAKFVAVQNGIPMEFPLATAVSYVDKYTAPTWFKHMTKNSFDEGNFAAEIYSLDSTKAAKLWQLSAAVSLPVMVRYSCEYFASDVTVELNKIKCPVLVLRSLYNEKVLQAPPNNYVKPQFIDSWNKAAPGNSLMKIKDIPGAASCCWKDKPAEVYLAIKEFMSTLN